MIYFVREYWRASFTYLQSPKLACGVLAIGIAWLDTYTVSTGLGLETLRKAEGLRGRLMAR